MNSFLTEQNIIRDTNQTIKRKNRYYSSFTDNNENTNHIKIAKTKKQKNPKKNKKYKELKLVDQFQKLLINKEKQEKKQLRNDVCMDDDIELFDILKSLKNNKKNKKFKNDIFIENVDLDNTKFIEYAISNNCMNSALELEKVDLKMIN